jgi:hypothetical protein
LGKAQAADSFRWTQRYAPELEKRSAWYRTRLTAKRSPRGATLDFYLADRRTAKAAQRFLAKALRRSRDWTPRVNVVDETQTVARAYGAVCTPDFFGFNADMELQYRGRLDASRTMLVPHARRELFEAMCRIAETGKGPREQHASMGCSIKWRE